MAEITRKELILLIAAVPDMACKKTYRLIRLAGVDLSGLDLTGLNLSRADFAGANLRGCNLSDASLLGADFSSADLTGALLRGVHAEEASFADARLPQVDFRLSERNCFYGTHLADANFEGADLTEARLGGASLEGANFSGARLAGASFIGAKIDFRTQFAGSDLAGALLDESWKNLVLPETRSLPILARPAVPVREDISQRRINPRLRVIPCSSAA